MLLYYLVETDLIPEQLIRLFIRRMLAQKLKEEKIENVELQQARLMQFISDLNLAPIAIATKAANEQHYELPTSFFQKILGDNLKYSCAYWTSQTNKLKVAEDKMLDLYCQRAQVIDGQSILDLGCGWGSLSLYLAKNYPNCKVTSLSNSKTQKSYIENEAAKQNLTNLSIVTANIAEYDSPLKYDRIISIEMFEHMKNYELLFKKLKSWLNPGAKVFAHIFCHKVHAYHYDDKSDWLAQHFFSGGTMPSKDLFLYFQKDLHLLNHWIIDGTHYKKTAEAWLANMKNNKQEIMPILISTYGQAEAKQWWVYWKLFFIAVAETWGYDRGTQWLVSHYLFE